MNEYELKQDFNIEKIREATKKGREKKVRAGKEWVKEKICAAALTGNCMIRVAEEYNLKEIHNFFKEMGFKTDIFCATISW